MSPEEERGEIRGGMSVEDAAIEETTDDTLLEGRLRLRQRRRGHRAGTDAVLVAAAIQTNPGETLVDLGAGTGAVGLMVAARVPDLTVVLVERDPALAALAAYNLAVNGIAGRVVEADVLAPRREREGRGLPPGLADVLATNPPFVEVGAAPASPEIRRASAHELPRGGFRGWLSTCADCLRHRGRLALIQRADRLEACLEGLAPAFGSIRVRPVYPRAGEGAIRVLLTAVRGGRGPLAIDPPLVLHGPDGRFTPEAESLHRGEALS